MTAPVQPLFRNVLVVREEPKESKVGSIYIPEAAKEKPLQGRVVAVGDKCRKLQVDDRVIVGRFAGSEFEFEHQKYLVLREEEVLGVILGDEPIKQTDRALLDNET